MMRNQVHHDGTLGPMRTTVTLAKDVAAAVDQLRREEGIGLSEAVNTLVRRGLTTERKPGERFVQRTHDFGQMIDVSNVAEAIEALEGPFAK
jgi:metal-responsive CopG/Arc/MetJ family transcriptional regulator